MPTFRIARIDARFWRSAIATTCFISIPPEGVVFQGVSEFSGVPSVPVIFPYPPGELLESRLVLRLNARDPHHFVRLLEYRGAHAAAIVCEESCLACKHGLDTPLVPGPAEIDVTHHLDVTHEPGDSLPVSFRFSRTDIEPGALDAEDGHRHRIQIMTGSGSSTIPNRPATASRMRTASPQTSAPVAWP